MSAIMQEIREYAKKFFYTRPNAQRLMRQVELPKGFGVEGAMKENYAVFEMFEMDVGPGRDNHAFDIPAGGFDYLDLWPLVSRGDDVYDYAGSPYFKINIPGIYMLTIQVPFVYNDWPDGESEDRPGSVYLSSDYNGLSGEAGQFYNELVAQYPGHPPHPTGDYNEGASEFRVETNVIIRVSNDIIRGFYLNDYYFYWYSPLSDSEVYDYWPHVEFYDRIMVQVFRLCDLEDEFL